jgi:hypothetical protein
MGDRAARIGGHGFPVPGAKALGALGEELEAPTKAGAAPPRRGLPDEGVVLLDLSRSDGSLPWGVMMGRELHRSASRRGSGGKWRPPVAPKPGRRGSPGWEGQKGRSGKSERPKLSRKTEEGQKEEEVRRRKKEPMDADAIPGSESRSLQSQYWRLGTGGGVAPGPSPAPKGIPDVRCGGLRVSRVASVVAGVEGWVALLASLPCGWQG